MVADAVLKPERRAEIAKEVARAIRAWKGGVPELFAGARGDAATAYALARLVVTAPSFEPLPALKLDDNKKLGTRISVAVSDVNVKGAFDVYGGRGVVILGDLAARAISADETAFLVVAGDVRVRAASGDGWILVGGDLEAEEVFGTYPADELRVAGTLTAPLAVFQDHGNRIGRKKVKHFIDAWQGDAKAKAALAGLATVVNRAAVKRGGVDLRALLRLVSAGKQALH